MNKTLEKYKTLLSNSEGFEAIQKEMNCQMDDVQKSLKSQMDLVIQLADAIKENKKIILLGMGASHFVNQIFSFQMRRINIEALAMTASEFLYDPINVDDRVIILTSQSGESVETVRCLERLESQKVFSVTLNKDSRIGKGSISIVANGGEEKAYAGTRSVTLSLVLLALTAAKLGAVDEESIHTAVQFEQNDHKSIDKALGLMYSKKNIFVTGRSLFAGVANLFSLGCEELSCVPLRFDETGQLRHGPLEMLSSDALIVLFRQSGDLGTLAKSFEDVVRKTFCSLVVIDSSGMEPLKDSVTIRCPVGNDITTILGIMSTFQGLMLSYACGKNPMTGIPKFSSKITTTE